MTEQKQRRLRKDSSQTRDALVRAAEQLYSVHGIDGVSLNEITRAAGQKNKSALLYHFGSREALVQAVIDRHAPAIVEKREVRLQKLSNRGNQTVEDVLRTLVEPLADMLEDKDGGEAYLRITAELFGRTDLHLYRLRSAHLGKNDALMKALAPFLPVLTPARWEIRQQLAGSLLFHALAEQAALQKDMTVKVRKRQKKILEEELVATLAALLTNP